MAMGKRKPRQESLFVAADQLAQAPGHPFYQKLNALLDEAGFDRWVERRCRQYYEQEETRGRPSVPPGVYFRMLFVGYFEGLGSQRGIAWRCGDSLGLRQFLGIPLDEPTPDHSTMTNTRKRLPSDVFEEVFQFVLSIAAAKKLLSGKTVGVDSTTLEANAAMKSIVRRDTGEDWKEYVTRLMREEGVIDASHEPTAEEVRRFDKKRKNKKVSNEDWKSATDGDARITQMKDGTTHLAYKAEHVVDLTGDLILAAEIYPGDQADTATLGDSMVAAQIHLKEAGSDAEIEEAAADKGYHAAGAIELCEFLEVRTYIPEPRRPHPSKWADKPDEHRRAVVNNRRRVRRAKSKKLQRRRSEVVERTFAARLRDGRSATDLATGVGGCQQTVQDRRRGAQPGPAVAPADRDRQAEGPARQWRLGRGSFGAVDVPPDRLLRGHRPASQVLASDPTGQRAVRDAVAKHP